MPPPGELKRSLSLPLLVLYGLGTTVGAGIYALVGEVAGRAGMRAPWSFAVASLLAAFTAGSFAELSSRLPRSAGEAEYVREGLGSLRLATVVGLLVVLAGTVSAATIANGFAGYLLDAVAVPRTAALLGLVVVLGLVAAWGITQAVWVASVVTALEIAGLLAVTVAAGDSFASLPARWPELRPEAGDWRPLFAGALLAFYAFLGFEDMVNVAEEVKRVRRTLPLAIGITLVVTTTLYVVVGLACVLTVPPPELRASGAPLALVFERASGASPAAIRLVGIVAMVNGALVQVIMASRVLYGLGRRGALPPRLARVSPRTHTPLLATGAVTLGVAVFALALPLAPLAELTSVLTLVVFALCNLALVLLKRRAPEAPGMRVPGWVPIVGFLVSAGFLAFEAATRLLS